MVMQQSKQIDQEKQSLPLYYHSLNNKIKNRSKQIYFDFETSHICYLKMQSSELDQFPYEYKAIIENLKIQDNFEKDLVNSPNSLGAISMKSLRSDKQFRIL